MGKKIELEIPDPKHLEAMRSRIIDKQLQDEDCPILVNMIDAYGHLAEKLAKQEQTIKKYQHMIFDPKGEKSKDILPPTDQPADPEPKKEPPAGHGRMKPDDYPDAERHCICHITIQSGQLCPSCKRGKVYRWKQPQVLVRIKGNKLFTPEIYELERLRCNLCGEFFTAEQPAHVGREKYDASAVSMIVLMKYGTGMPFYRLDKFTETLGVPMPAATQWDIVDFAADHFEDIYASMIRHAAMGDLFHNDDTPVKIMELKRNIYLKKISGMDPPRRTGIYTSSIISKVGEQKIALYYSSHSHAGENLAKVLRHRPINLDPPLQMCDGKSENVPRDFATILSNCLAHARRKFVEIYDNFPDECRHVIEMFKFVYAHDAETKDKMLTPAQRLEHHKTYSRPILDRFKEWFEDKFQKKLIEPNSNLGQAIHYMQKRWTAMIRFTEVEGAPLDNNICERALKKAILSRKNSYFYKSVRGAKVGDLFMSLIHTCELNKINPFDYFNAVLNNKEKVHSNPANWTPLNYQLQL